MELAYAFFAKAGEFGQDGSLTVMGADIDCIITPAVPVTVPSLTFIARLRAEREEAGEEHRFQGRLLDAEGKDLLPSQPEVPLTLKQHPSAPANVKAGVGIAVQMMGLVFQKFGEYRFEIYVDGKKIGEVCLSIAPPPPASGVTQ